MKQNIEKKRKKYPLSETRLEVWIFFNNACGSEGVNSLSNKMALPFFMGGSGRFERMHAGSLSRYVGSLRRYVGCCSPMKAIAGAIGATTGAG